MPRDEAGLAGMSERFAEHWETCGFGLWALRPPDGLGAGWIGACHPRWHPEYELQVELAWSVTATLRGRGLVTQAARAAVAGCFEELGLDEVVAFVNPENAPSRAVVDRLGMRPSGSTHDPKDGVQLDVFTLTRGEGGGGPQG
jgi:RimJ/RimL family protein N-acetyltransferase